MGDIKLDCGECGTGFPLILLHGNGESRAYFNNQLAPFSARFRVIAPDTRGHGGSPRGGAPFTLEQFADDLKELLDEKHIARAHLLGFSDGGNVALLFALKYPQYVERLILNGANLSPAGVKPAVQAPTALGYALAALIAPFDKKAAAKKELLALMVKQPHISPASLAAIKAPALVVAGKHDMIRASHTRLIAASLPDARLCILDGDHFVAAKKSAAFNEAVLEFLG